MGISISSCEKSTAAISKQRKIVISILTVYVSVQRKPKIDSTAKAANEQHMLI